MSRLELRSREPNRMFKLLSRPNAARESEKLHHMNLRASGRRQNDQGLRERSGKLRFYS